MTDVLALEKLYADVVQRFVDEGADVAQPFGWRAPSEQSGSINRIAWVPGDPSGGAGTFRAAKYPGRLPARPLLTMVERFQVVVSSYDDADPDSEIKQYAATRRLFDAWLRACYLAAHGTFTADAPTWVHVTNERRLGAALRCVCSVESMIPDEQAETMPAEGRKAIVTVRNLENVVVESLTVLRDET